MNTTKYRIAKTGGILAVVALIGWYATGVGYAQHSHAMHGNMQMQMTEPKATAPKAAEETPSLQIIYSKQLPAVQEAVARAIQHLQAGHQPEAMKELQQIKASLDAVQKALAKHVGPQFINDRCPIMGGKVNTENIPAALTRMHGQDKVAFCCAGCPAQWDRLTEAEKTAQLERVTAGPAQPHHGM